MYLIGGDKIEYDLERIQLKGANVVVATPGRLFDLAIEKHALSFRKLEVLIMDEADKLL
jgi:superfamily II DNA/RNA helicase